MQKLRIAALLHLFAACIAITTAAQQETSKPLTGDNGSFAISLGSTFSASGRSKEPKVSRVTAPAIKAISSDLDELLDLVRTNHISGRKLNDEKLIGSAITSMLQQLDPHSDYYTRDEFRELNDDHQGRYYGIGTTISNFKHNNALETYILSVKKNTPAERAGLRFGDRIVQVNGEEVSGLVSIDVRNRVRGPLGSSVKLTIERGDGTIVRNIAIRRDRVGQRSVTDALLLENQIGYIALTEGFGYTTAAEFDLVFNSLKQQGMRSLIVDLRGNGGGLMDQAILVAEKFLPLGQMIVSQRGRNAAEDREWRSRNQRPESMPLVFLVDEGTASASEILAAAMQDNDRAAILGKRTFGKGLVQNVIPLEDGSGLTLTSERYYTPSGRSIQREYSDSGLYDYFRHTNHGSLIGKPEVAARTRKGRVVFGGDGILPDEIVDSFEMTPPRTAAIDRLFNFLRAMTASEIDDETAFAKYCDRKEAVNECATDTAFVRFQLAQFRKLRSETNRINIANVLRSDPQSAAAIRLLEKRIGIKP